MPDLEQARRALVRANEIRYARADIKRRIAIGQADARALLLDPPPFAEGMEVADVVESVPKVGPVKRDKILRAVGWLSPMTPLASLPMRTRMDLASRLPGPLDRYRTS